MEFKIDMAELIGLLEIRQKYNALEQGGVDNWEWYDESLNDYEFETIDEDYILENYRVVEED